MGWSGGYSQLLPSVTGSHLFNPSNVGACPWFEPQHSNLSRNAKVCLDICSSLCSGYCLYGRRTCEGITMLGIDGDIETPVHGCRPSSTDMLRKRWV
jgi:hypothetical protein